MTADERQSRLQLLNHWIDVTGRALPQFAADYAQSDAMAASAPPSANTPTYRKIAADLTAAGVEALWLLRSDGTCVLQVQSDGSPALAPPLARSDFSALIANTPNSRFFTEMRGAIAEICIRRLPPLGGRDRDWLVVMRRWDDAWLRTLGNLTDSATSLVAPTGSATAATAGTKIVLLRPLPDWQGRPLRLLRIDYDSPELNRLLQTDSRQARIFVVFGLLLTVALGLALNAWVLRPLASIGESLARGDPASLGKLSNEKNELGRIAQLVVSSFAQRDELRGEIAERAQAQVALERTEATLRRTMEERARLGRDLHDGVIQSLYAAGMGLTGVRAMLLPGQTEAAVRLEQTRGALNETIHDVRNFIGGLEPEALKLHSFTHAVTALLEVVQGVHPLHTVVEIDEKLAGLLTLAQRVHALQITREAVSNALRHGDANQVIVSLRPTGEHVEFEIADNGRGFDPAAREHSGLGLHNFSERARELGAELTVTSAPGRGARVKLVFALCPSL